MGKKHRLSNKEVVNELKEALAAMEIKNYNIFRIRAYQNAIAAIDNLTSSVFDLWENHRLGEIPGVGEGLADHLNELFTTGEVKEFKVIKHDLPQGMFSLIGLRGVGAKRAYKLAKEFDLNSREEAVEKLKEVAEQGRIRVLEGFGEKSEKELLNAIIEVKKTKAEKQRLLISHAEEVAGRAIEFLESLPGVEKAQALGSLRRRNPTIGDIDIVVVGKDGNNEEIMKSFLKFPEIKEVLAQGEKKISVMLTNEVQLDLRVATTKTYGSMVQYFTGSKQHNIVLRTYALDHGMSLSEYGIKENGVLHEFEDEESFYAKLGLDHIPPEIRHGKDEVLLAKEKKLPKLVNTDDIKGDLHTHTIASDGVNTLAEMVNEAKNLGYEYIGIADHSPSIQSRGYEEVKAIIERQRKSIDSLNEAQDGIRVLFGYEVNILADATLSLPDEFLSQLDYVIASIHTAFNQEREVITDRILRAIENPYTTIIGHPTGRLINERDAIDADWDKVIDACKAHKKVLEINAYPNRLDLPDDLVYEAIKKNLRLIINTDAHVISELYLMRYGIDVARRGFAEPKNIINTYSAKDLLETIQLTRVDR
jgi:DNA polymerase (family X)